MSPGGAREGRLGRAVFFLAGLLILFFALSHRFGHPSGGLRPGSGRVSLGAVRAGGPPARADVVVTNAGSRPVELADLSTSGPGLTARVVYRGAEGPLFGQRGEASASGAWRQEIPGYGEFLLRVVYDPAADPGGRGEMVRLVDLYVTGSAEPAARVEVALERAAAEPPRP